MWPSDLGGVNWSGIAYDSRSQRVIAAVNHLAMVVTLSPISAVSPITTPTP